MKKILLSLAVLSLLCSAYKSDDAPSPDSWQVGAGNYTPVRTTASTFGVFYTLSAVTGTGASSSTITFMFGGPAKPTAGMYRVVYRATGPNQLSFSTSAKPFSVNTNYESTGSDQVDAVVSVTNGKVSISMPDAVAKNILGTDSIKVSADITRDCFFMMHSGKPLTVASNAPFEHMT